VASNATFAFAHEAPVYVAETDEVFFASNDGGALGHSDLDHNNQVGKISMKAVEAALQTVKAKTGAAVNVPVTEVRKHTFLGCTFTSHSPMSARSPRHYTDD